MIKLFLIILFIPITAVASHGTGTISATLINPKKLNEKELLKFCAYEPQVKLCKEIENKNFVIYSDKVIYINPKQVLNIE